MTHKIEADFWQGLGVQAWQTRPGYGVESALENIPNQQNNAVEALDSVPKVTQPSSKGSAADGAVYWVLIGHGLSQVWQNQNDQAWLLWQAMIEHHFGTIEKVRFFDTASIVSEESAFEKVEEIIELGVDWVYSMEPDHPLPLLLAEGLPVITLPSFDQMLAQPLLKRDVYLALIQPETQVAAQYT